VTLLRPSSGRLVVWARTAISCAVRSRNPRASRCLSGGERRLRCPRRTNPGPRRARSAALSSRRGLTRTSLPVSRPAAGRAGPNVGCARLVPGALSRSHPRARAYPIQGMSGQWWPEVNRKATRSAIDAGTVAWMIRGTSERKRRCWTGSCLPQRRGWCFRIRRAGLCALRRLLPDTSARRGGPREHGRQAARSKRDRPERAGELDDGLSHVRAAARRRLDPIEGNSATRRLDRRLDKTGHVWTPHRQSVHPVEWPLASLRRRQRLSCMGRQGASSRQWSDGVGASERIPQESSSLRVARRLTYPWTCTALRVPRGIRSLSGDHPA
jgi:hypothetical protein